MGTFAGLQSEPQPVSSRIALPAGAATASSGNAQPHEAALRNDPVRLVHTAQRRHYPITQPRINASSIRQSQHIGMMDAIAHGRKRCRGWSFTSRRPPPQSSAFTHPDQSAAEHLYKRNYQPALAGMTPYHGSQWWALSRDRSHSRFRLHTKGGSSISTSGRSFRRNVLSDDLKLALQGAWRQYHLRGLERELFAQSAPSPKACHQFAIRIFIDDAEGEISSLCIHRGRLLLGRLVRFRERAPG
jgi:hypothetical protein